MRLELTWLDQHSEVQGKRHAPIPRSQRSRGVRSMPCKSGVCYAVFSVEVTVPLSATLDGGAVILSRALHSSSVLRSVVVRLATVGMHDAVDARVAIGVAIDALWGATRVVSPPPSVKRCVDHGDNELVDVMTPLPCYRQRSV
jgi:hypothetical protein